MLNAAKAVRIGNVGAGKADVCMVLRTVAGNQLPGIHDSFNLVSRHGSCR